MSLQQFSSQYTKRQNRDGENETLSNKKPRALAGARRTPTTANHGARDFLATYPLWPITGARRRAQRLTHWGAWLTQAVFLKLAAGDSTAKDSRGPIHSVGAGPFILEIWLCSSQAKYSRRQVFLAEARPRFSAW